MKTIQVSSLPNGSFPLAPINTVLSLSLGNGSRFDVICTPSERGLVLSVIGKGSYPFHFAPSYAYLAGKLGLLDGDAICFVRFLSAQLEGTSAPSPVIPLLDQVISLCESFPFVSPSSQKQGLTAIRELARDARGMLR